LNSDGREKLRKRDWLISAILREINQLRGMGEAEGKGAAGPAQQAAAGKKHLRRNCQGVYTSEDFILQFFEV